MAMPDRITILSRSQSACFFIAGCVLAVLLVCYNQDMPCFNVANSQNSSGISTNVADFLYQAFGVAAIVWPVMFFIMSAEIIRFNKILPTIRLFHALLVVVLSSCVLTYYSGQGGALGFIFNSVLSPLKAILPGVFIDVSLFSLLIILALVPFAFYVKWSAVIPQKATTNIEPKNTPHNIKSPRKKVEPKAVHVKTPNPILSPLPHLSFLHSAPTKVIATGESYYKEQAATLLSTLQDFGISGQIKTYNTGPVVTLYEFEPASGIKSSRIIGLADDIARSMRALSARISVIPGKNAMGIELPNKHRETVVLKELLEYCKNESGDLPLVIGKSIAGEPIIADLATMPHLLIAGTTGAGKSVAVNAMILSLLYRHTPETCRFIMIDPKMLELSAYNDIPHLLIPVVTEPKKAIAALKWAVKEMENRYQLISSVGARNISGYNSRIKTAIENNEILERKAQVGFNQKNGDPIIEKVPIPMQTMPFIVLIVDEMADLMLVAGKDVEVSVQRLSQMARAAGIHIILATQRPSVDVITGVIKANFATRISFAVTSKIDSRTIINEQGAEQLLRMGDMLFLKGGSKIIRAHGPLVTDMEVQKVADFLRSTGKPQYVDGLIDEVEGVDLSVSEGCGDDQELYLRAVDIVRQHNKVSISYVQRQLRIGYNRAAILVERMEQEGIVSAVSHSGKREVL